MGSAIDMAGEVFSNLTVIERAGTNDVNRTAMWRCRCRCGSEVLAEGTALRKGKRRSCGCLDGRRKAQEANSMTKTNTDNGIAETSRWIAEEADGTTFLLRRVGSKRTALVDHDGTRWVCSEDGPQQLRGAATGQCPHVQVAARTLSPAAAVLIAGRIANPHAKRGLAGAEKAEKVISKTQAEMVAAGAEVRATRAREHDEVFVAATPVVVRQMTEEDRRKLQEARARRARTFREPDRITRFVG